MHRAESGRGPNQSFWPSSPCGDMNGITFSWTHRVTMHTVYCQPGTFTGVFGDQCFLGLSHRLLMWLSFCPKPFTEVRLPLLISSSRGQN